jgi:hypothetical protein
MVNEELAFWWNWVETDSVCTENLIFFHFLPGAMPWEYFAQNYKIVSQCVCGWAWKIHTFLFYIWLQFSFPPICTSYTGWKMPYHNNFSSLVDIYFNNGMLTHAFPSILLLHRCRMFISSLQLLMFFYLLAKSLSGVFFFCQT